MIERAIQEIQNCLFVGGLRKNHWRIDSSHRRLARLGRAGHPLQLAVTPKSCFFQTSNHIFKCRFVPHQIRDHPLGLQRGQIANAALECGPTCAAKIKMLKVAVFPEEKTPFLPAIRSATRRALSSPATSSAPDRNWCKTPARPPLLFVWRQKLHPLCKPWSSRRVYARDQFGPVDFAVRVARQQFHLVEYRRQHIFRQRRRKFLA